MNATQTASVGLLMVLVLAGLPSSAIAQVSAADDETGTRVRQRGDRFLIDGGRRSRDGDNLFHSLEEFGLDEEQIANFLSDPEVRNILSRVVGGDASIINGLIRVTGSEANLYLMNPAGIIFGSDARLDVPGSFTATTADSIGFGDRTFNAIGSNNYAALIGNPDQFIFSSAEPGSIINAGDLSVSDGEFLTLLGGSVINTGTLTAPDGTITIAAIPGENRVRISQEGMVLSLELDALDTVTHPVPGLPFQPLSLPALLTQEGVTHATEVTVNPDGSVQLTGSGISIPMQPGTAIASGDISAPNISQGSESGETGVPLWGGARGGSINLLGDRIALINADLDASGTLGGGSIRIGGELRGQGDLFNASATFIDANSTVSANAFLDNTQNTSGDGGRIIIFANDTTQIFGNLSAQGGTTSGNGGFIETSGLQNFSITNTPNVTATNGLGGDWLIDPNNIEIIAGAGAANIDPLVSPFESDDDNATLGVNLIELALVNGGDVIVETTNSGANTEDGDITLSAPLDFDDTGNGTLRLRAANDIIIDVDPDPAVLAFFDLDETTLDSLNLFLEADIDGNGTGEVSISNSIETFGGTLDISAAEDIVLDIDVIILTEGGNIDFSSTLGDIDTIGATLDSSSLNNVASGNIRLIAENGTITTGLLDAASVGNVNAGNIILEADGDIELDDSVLADATTANGGLISITSTSGIISTISEIRSDVTQGRGGDIRLDADGNILTSDVLSFSNAGTGGNINITSQTGTITTDSIDAGSDDGNSGNVSLLADGEIIVDEILADSFLNGAGGNIAVTSTTGAFTVLDVAGVDGTLDTSAEGGNAGNVSVQAAEIAVNDVLTFSNDGGNGGAINLRADGDIFTGSLDSQAFINGNAGNLSVISQTGEVSVLGEIDTSTEAGRAGDVRLRAENDLSLSEVLAFSTEDGDGGTVEITSRTGAITTEAIDATTGNGQGGRIILSAAEGITVIGGLETEARNVVGRNGQDIRLTGDSNNDGEGVVLVTDSIFSGGGRVVISGASVDDIAISIQDITSEGGNIRLTGTSVNNDGLVISDSLFSDNGNIRLEGTSTNSQGLVIEPDPTATDPLFIAAGTGEVILEGQGGADQDGIVLNAEVEADRGITIRSDRPNLDFADTVLTGVDVLTISPFNDTLTQLEIGGRRNGSELFLSDRELLAIQPGFSNIIIGSNTYGGNIELRGTANFPSPVSLRSPAPSGRLTGNNFSLTAPSIDFRIGNSFVIANGQIEVTDADLRIAADFANNNRGSVQLRNSTILTNGNNLLIDGTGNNQFSEGIFLSTTTLDAGGGNIQLRGQGNTSNNSVGVRIVEQSQLITNRAGEIQITGGLRNETNTPRTGLQISNSQLSTNNGAIDLRASSNNIGIAIAQNSRIESRGNGSVSLTSEASSGGDGIAIANSQLSTRNQPLSLTTRSGDLNLQSTTLNSNGGQITLNSADRIQASTLDSRQPDQVGGAIQLTAPGNIRTEDIISGGGDIQINSQNGQIDTSNGELDTNNPTLVSQGTIVLTAPNDIIGGRMRAEQGRITFNTPATVRINNPDVVLQGGTFQIPNASEIVMTGSGSIMSGGGVIDLQSGQMAIAPDITLDSNNPNGIGGAINLTTTQGNLTVGNLDSSGDRGGNISVESATNLTAGNITARGSINNDGGSIDLQAPQGIVTTGDLITSGRTGGNITVVAQTEITAQRIRSLGLVGNGGNVDLDPENDIEVSFIDAQGGDEGQGGQVNIVTNRFFRATDVFGDRNGVNASISTAGGQGGGNIRIRNNGASEDTPFVVQDAGTVSNNSVEPVDNGTVGVITTGEETAPDASYREDFLSPQASISIQSGFGPDNGSDPPSIVDDTDSTDIITDLDDPDPDPIVVDDDLDDAGLLPSVDVAVSNPIEIADVAQLDTAWSSEYLEYFSADAPIAQFSNPQAILRQIETQTNVTPAILYVRFAPALVTEGEALLDRQPTDQLELVLITTEGDPIRQQLPGVTREQVQQVSNSFVSQITDPRRLRSDRYLTDAQQLYDWIIAPMQADLDAQEIQNISFILDSGVRSLPIAALHDGEQFLVEQYSLGLMPSLNLTDTQHVDMRNNQVLAMGASEFTDQTPLPAVPIELDLIAGNLWDGEAFINEEFTLANLQQQRQQTPFGIIHLATHGEFRPGGPENSYIQLWDQQLQLDQIRELGWSDPPVNLVVLSACRTALGDDEAELGFAGLAIQSGARSALASLWYVSDSGTLGFMSEFYGQLNQVPIRAEAVRQAQLAMIRGEVRFEGTELRSSRGSSFTLPQSLGGTPTELTHPFFWSAFTIIGNPW